jgi:carbon storage regulator
MLMLTRKPNQSIVIGDEDPIVITIRSVDGHHVKVGIQAKANIPVHRQEVYDRIKLEQEKVHSGANVESQLIEEEKVAVHAFSEFVQEAAKE